MLCTISDSGLTTHHENCTSFSTNGEPRKSVIIKIGTDIQISN